MAEKGLREWVKEKWVDIGAPKKKDMNNTLKNFENNVNKNLDSN